MGQCAHTRERERQRERERERESQRARERESVRERERERDREKERQRETMFTFIVFEILPFEGRSILRPAQRFPRNERVNRCYSLTKLFSR